MVDHDGQSALWALRQILHDLPSNRDWLCPQVEGIARDLVARSPFADLAAAPTPSEHQFTRADIAQLERDAYNDGRCAEKRQADSAPSVASCLREAWVPRCEHARIVAELRGQIETLAKARENSTWMLLNIQTFAGEQRSRAEAAEARAEALAGVLQKLRANYYKHPQPCDMRRIDALLNPPTERPHGT